MDPYEILGVARDADEREIRAAYRKFAKANHPDIGGDADLMADGTACYRMLLDADRRARYDQTGVFEEGDAEGAAQSRAINVLVGAWDAVMCKLIEGGRALKDVDMTNMVRLHLSSQEVEINKAMKRLRADIDLLGDVADRVSCSEEDSDPIGAHLRGQLEKMRVSEVGQQRQLEAILSAKEIVDGYTFRYDQMEMFGASATTSSTSASPLGGAQIFGARG